MIFGFLSKHKKITTAAIMVFAACSFTFADAASEVNTTVGNIVNFFSNNWVKGIACIAFIAECLGLLFAGGQNPQIFKKFLPLIAGTVLFMCAGKIVTLVFGTSDLKFSDDLNMSMTIPDVRTDASVNAFANVMFGSA